MIEHYILMNECGWELRLQGEDKLSYVVYSCTRVDDINTYKAKKSFLKDIESYGYEKIKYEDLKILLKDQWWFLSELTNKFGYILQNLEFSYKSNNIKGFEIRDAENDKLICLAYEDLSRVEFCLLIKKTDFFLAIFYRRDILLSRFECI